MVAAIDDQPDVSVQVQFTDLLQAIDLMHREGLVRLATLLRAAGAGDALDGASDDPVVRTLLGIYGLAELDLPPDEPELQELQEPPEPARKPVQSAQPAGNMSTGFFPIERLTVRRSTPEDGRVGQE